jgi:hypothetical protein
MVGWFCCKWMKEYLDLISPLGIGKRLVIGRKKYMTFTSSFFHRHHYFITLFLYIALLPAGALAAAVPRSPGHLAALRQGVVFRTVCLPIKSVTRSHARH